MSYTNKVGEDLYDRGAPLYYAVQILLGLYSIGYFCSLVLLQNAQVVNTYTKGLDYGTLYSNRYDSLYWFALMFSAMRIFVIVFVCLGILFRKTTCCGCKFSCCTGIWLTLLIIVIMFNFLTLSILSTHYSKCNGLDQLDNPCNDKRWCCVEEIYVNPANKCGNTCTPYIPYNTLVADVDFIWLFSLTVVFCAFDLVFMLLPIGLWLNNGMPTNIVLGRINIKSNDEENVEKVAAAVLPSEQIDSPLKRTRRKVVLKTVVADPKMTKQT